MKRWLLKIICSFTGFWARYNINAHQLYAIVQAKLLMDKRRQLGFYQTANPDKSKWTDIILAIFYFLFGAMSIIFLLIENRFSAYTIYFSFWIIVLTITLITDFTDVIFDVRDYKLLFTRPVNNNTLTFARVLHLIIYLMGLLIPFSIPVLIFFLIKGTGILFVPLIIQLCLGGLVFSIFFVNIVFLSLLKYVSSRVFKDVINYFQIIFTSVVFGAYFVIPNLISLDQVKDFNISEFWWSWLLPGSYFAGMSSLVEGDISMQNIVSATLGILIPFIMLWLISSVLSKNLNQKLLEADMHIQEEDLNIIKEESSSRYARFWNNILHRNNIEKQAFLLSWNLSARDRTFKLRTYPIFAFVPAYAFYFLLDGDGSLSEKIEVLRTGSQDLFLIYFSCMAILTTIINAFYSSTPKAANIFLSSPIRKPGYLIRGTVSAMIVKFGIPFYLFTCAIVLSIWGISSWQNMIIGAINIVFISILFTYSSIKKLPHSDSWDNQSKGTNSGMMLVMVIVLGVIGFVHFILNKIPIGLYAATFLILLITIFLYRDMKNVSWMKIFTSES